MLNSVILKVRRRESPFYDILYRSVKGLRNVNVPSIKFIHLPLYHLYRFFRTFISSFMEKVFWVPMFKARADRCGSGLRLTKGIPFIVGENLVIDIGDDVCLDEVSFMGLVVCDSPKLTIGDRTSIGFGVSISVAKEVTIGNDVKMASLIYICDNDAHPKEPERRQGRITESEVSPVRIGNNVWLCYGAVILKGTEIGDGSIVAAKTVVGNMVIPPNSLVYGSPPKIKPL